MISASVAEEVRRKLAFVYERDSTVVAREGERPLLRVELDVWGLREGFSAPRDEMASPRMWLKGSGSLALESTIWATLIRSKPTRFWRARTVARWSGGYSSSKKRTSECAARYVSKWGIMRVARRYEFVKGLSCCLASG